MASLNTLTSEKELFDSGLAQIRIIDHPLSHGLFIINGENSTGELRVETYIYKRRPNRTPGFLIRKSQDPELFDLFFNEFNEMWDKAQSYV
jgi:hypothetical protein